MKAEEISTECKKCFKDRSFDTYNQAEEFYLMSLQRLLNVSSWNALSESPSEFYKLLNAQAEAKSGVAEEGDFILVSDSPLAGATTCYRIERKISKLHEQNRSMAVVTRPVLLFGKGPTTTFSTTTNDTFTFVLQLLDKNVSIGIYEKGHDTNVIWDESFYEKLVHKVHDIFVPKKENHWYKLAMSILK